MEHSNKEYDDLGNRIRKNPTNISNDDKSMLQDLRLSYKDSLSKIYSEICSIAHKVDKSCICTFRLKRIESIISKTIRNPKMNIKRMGDIGGCRCILHKEEQVYKLYDKIHKLVEKNELSFKIKSEKNYIKEPKVSGYRSIHINVSLKSENKQIEIQLRSLEQHNWATLVEITDLLFGSQLKEYGDKKSPRLFSLHQLLSISEDKITIGDKIKIVDIIIKENYLEEIGSLFNRNYMRVRDAYNKIKLNGKHFFLISTNNDKVPLIEAFCDYEEAEKAYYEKYLNNSDSNNILLTSLQKPKFEKISIAYSNYILSYNDSYLKILRYISDLVINSFSYNKIFRFIKVYKYFLTAFNERRRKYLEDTSKLNENANIKNTKRKSKEWNEMIKGHKKQMKYIYDRTHDGMRFSWRCVIPWCVAKIVENKFNN